MKISSDFSLQTEVPLSFATERGWYYNPSLHSFVLVVDISAENRIYFAPNDKPWMISKSAITSGGWYKLPKSTTITITTD